jgi:hypothetical protein
MDPSNPNPNPDPNPNIIINNIHNIIINNPTSVFKIDEPILNNELITDDTPITNDKSIIDDNPITELQQVKNDIEASVNFSSLGDSIDAINNPDILLNRMQTAFDQFKNKVGRNMTYSEMREMMG